MRHGKKVNHLGRQKGHRTALLKNLGTALVTHKRITTTLAKAKALRVYIEPLVTKAKTNNTHNRRIVFSYLQSKEAVTELFDAVGPKVATRPGGYTRIIKLGARQGDAAEMAMIELVDFNENLLGGTPKAAGKKRRSRRGSGTAKAETATTTAAPAKEAKEEAKADEAVEETATAEAPAAEEVTEQVAEAAAEETSEEAPEAKEDAADDTEEKKEDKA